MARSGLASEITKLSKQKMIPAIVVDVLGDRCSIRLSKNGKLLTNLRYFGVPPVVGDSVYVDYRTGTPMVYTSGTTAVATDISVDLPTTGAPIETIPPPASSGLRTYTWVIESPAVGGVGGPRINRASTAVSVYAHVNSGTAEFNIELRASPETPDDDILTADLEAYPDGEHTDAGGMDFTDLTIGYWLHIDISAVTGATELTICFEVSS